MTHEQLRDRLLDLACGELAPREVREVEEHAAACEACRAELDRMRETRRIMAALPAEPAPPGGERILLAAAREAAERRRARRAAPRWLWGAVVAAASLAVVAGVSYRLIATGPRPLDREDPDALMGEQRFVDPAPSAEGPAPRREAPPPAPVPDSRARGPERAGETLPPAGEAGARELATPFRSEDAEPPAAPRAPASPPAPAPDSRAAGAKRAPDSHAADAARADDLRAGAGAERAADGPPTAAAEEPPARAAAPPDGRAVDPAEPERTERVDSPRAAGAGASAAPAPSPPPPRAAAAQRAAPRAPTSAAEDRYDELRREGRLRAEIRTFPGCEGEAWRKVELAPGGQVVKYVRLGWIGGRRLRIEHVYGPDGALASVTAEDLGGGGPLLDPRSLGIAVPERAEEAGPDAPPRCGR
jgi:hypothetical protein